MDNYKLLEKYKKKLSIYFSIFIIFSIWIIELLFLFSIYYSNNIDLNNKLEARFDGIVNVLENKENYINKVESNDISTKLILEKSLRGVSIYENGNLILGDLNINILGDKKILNSKNYKYYQNNIIINTSNYTILIKADNQYSYYNLLVEYIYFILYTLVFSIIFYYIGYKFVSNNFKAIEETISSLESFSADINHEMKTPLSEIISTLELTKKTKTNYKESIDQSLNSAKNLNKILDSMLGIINIVGGSYKKENLNIIKLIENIIDDNKTQIKNKEIVINKNFSQKKIYKDINREHFHICIGNILNNAIKYSKKRSEIDISFNNGKIIIKDYGIGIEEKNLKNIFDRYFRENYNSKRGYGLGLALVKKIVDINLWEILVKSKKDKGTLFQITIK